MNKIFTPVNFTTTSVGKLIKSSKKRMSWNFLLESHPHTIDLFLSRVSGKRVVLLDGYIISRNAKDPKFFGAYPVKIKKFTIVVFEYENGKFDLKLGDFSFNEEINKKHSAHEEVPGEVVMRKRHQTTKEKNKEKLFIDFKEIHEREDRWKGINSPLSAGVHRYNPFDDIVEGDEYSHKVIQSNFPFHSPQGRINQNYCNSAEKSPISSPSNLNIFDEDAK